MSNIVLDLFLRDHGVTNGLRQISGKAGITYDKFSKLKIMGAAAIAAVGVAVVKFGKDSIAAYGTAQKAQAELGFAFQKFPALADTNQKALQKRNTELQKNPI